MEKIITQTDKNTLRINTTDTIELSIERGHQYGYKQKIKLTKRQVNKLIEELNSALANCG